MDVPARISTGSNHSLFWLELSMCEGLLTNAAALSSGLGWTGACHRGGAGPTTLGAGLLEALTRGRTD